MKNQLNRSYLFLLSLAALLIMQSSCVTPEKLSLQGDYDGAIHLAVKKLKKKKQNDKYILSLEEAFLKATRRDNTRIKNLKLEGLPESWVEINKLYKTIGRRQSLIQPLLPLFISSQGREADFEYINVSEGEVQSKEKAAEYLYARGKQLLDRAKKGDKLAAREAYAEFRKTKEYYKDYRDREDLMNEASNLGMNRILFKMENISGAILPRGFEQEMLRMTIDDLNRNWKQYYLEDNGTTKFDYSVTANFTRVSVSPERVAEREYVDEKEIEDGFDYVLDGNGNVLKDTLGNDIKIPKTKIIRVSVLEIHQTKSAIVSGRMDYRDLSNNELIKTIPLTTEAIFDHYSATFRGDKRALSKDSRNRLGNQPLPFPTDPDMVMMAAEELKPMIRQMLVEYKELLEY